MEIQSQSINTQTVSVQGNSAGVVRTVAAPSTAPASTSTSNAPADRKQLEEAVSKMSSTINITEPPQLEFSIDEATDRTIVRVTDATTGELIRQLPSEEALAIAESLDKMQGLLLRQQA